MPADFTLNFHLFTYYIPLLHSTLWPSLKLTLTPLTLTALSPLLDGFYFVEIEQSLAEVLR